MQNKSVYLECTFEKAARRARKTPEETVDSCDRVDPDPTADGLTSAGWIWNGNSQTKNGSQQQVNDDMTMAVVLNARPSSRQKRANNCCCILLSRSQYLVRIHTTEK